ncbi:4165_t:CDS:2 [Rhizophagus irregularis]|nr:4165_t:CDS:2 [Rhizophagus irregularis]
MRSSDLLNQRGKLMDFRAVTFVWKHKAVFDVARLDGEVHVPVYKRVHNPPPEANIYLLLQSSFASLSSGAGIIAYGSDIFFPKKKARANESKDEPNDGPNDEPKAEVIRLSIERNLGEKLDRTTNKLRDKRHDLEKAMSWLSIWAIFASIIILLLVGIDFFGLLPDIKYLDIGLDLFLSITGAYCLFCTHTLKTVLTSPRGKLESSHLILFVFVIPCASLVGLLDDDVWIGSIIFGFFAPCYYKGKHWVKEVYLSPDEKVEIQYLLHGLNPDLSLLRINKFCKEFILENPANESKSKFVEKVNEIESKSKKEILYKHFELGKALVDHIFSEAEDKSPEESVDEKIVDIVKKFSLKSFFFHPDVKIIKQHYMEFSEFQRGLTLAEFFDRYPQIRHRELISKEIDAAHNALKVYSIFNDEKGIGKDKIKLTKTFSDSSIGKLTRNEIFNIIEMVKSISTQ